MNPRHRIWLAALVSLSFLPYQTFGDEAATDLPQGVRAVWDLTKAYRQSTPSEEKICLNGLWRWQPAKVNEETVPKAAWGYFKVPGSWPGVTDYMQKDSQTLFTHADWKNLNLRELSSAWYEREISIPIAWGGRRISLYAEYLNSFVTVYVDGKIAGEIHFPAGDVDISKFCSPGKKHLLSLRVVAMPLKGVLLSYTDSASAREVKGSVARRGLCGDVFLIATREVPRISEINVETSIRNGELVINSKLANLVQGARYRMQARLSEKESTVAEFKSNEFGAADLTEGHFKLTEKWKPEKLWDIHTPQNQYDLVVSLLDAKATVLDRTYPTRFGFRELWINGRDFYLNGTRIFLSAVPLDNAEVGAAWATYDAARESLERLKSFGINFVYTHNYGCEPGSHLSFAEVLRAADDVGMLVALSQPHFSHYEWKSQAADETNGYARHARFYADVAGDHPSVVFYAMSHNATGYGEDMNPDMIDGLKEPRDLWALNNAKLALRAEAIVNRIDPTRIVYHHASGNLGSMHPMNFYPNFVPIQELSDWFGHWATNGVKPAFMYEYGAPFTWDWTMYRGWYKGQREFGSAKVPWEFCVAEWNSQFIGDRAYQISEPEKANLRWEAKQFREGNLWHRWDYPNPVGSSRFTECYPIFAKYLTDNWRAFRGWGVSAISPWEYEHYWTAKQNLKRTRIELPVDWENLQRPGFSPDYIDQRYERMDLAFEKSDWEPTIAAEALIRNNRPLLGFIAGKKETFTSKDHNFSPGEKVEKQLIVINNSRVPATVTCDWSLALPHAVNGNQKVSLETGEQTRIPLQFELPRNVMPGQYELTANFRFDSGETQDDSFSIHVLPPAPAPGLKAKIALFDPKGETTSWLKQKGAHYETIDAQSDLSGYDVLIVGKSALTLGAAAPDISRIREGLKVLIFEQTSEVLEKRFGFRIEEYGLRQLFERVPDHPLFSGLTPENLHDWRGSATLLPPRLSYEMRARYGPTVKWCDIPVTRIWRCGNRGNVASVLIEKPPGGDFLPVLDGGYSLQYSPLLEYRAGKGMILFCQLDLTSRSETDPAAEILGSNLLRYIDAWKPAPSRKVIYAGEPAGKAFLESIGITVASYNSKPGVDDLLVVAPKGPEILSPHKDEIGKWLKAGGHLLAIGLNASEANTFLPLQISTADQEHISCYFDAANTASPFRGISPADLHNREPRKLPLISAGAETLGDGILAEGKEFKITFCQIVPWQFDNTPMNIKGTHRRVSFALSRLLGNLGASSSSPILERFHTPPDLSREKRYLIGLYLDQPEEWDDPYRFFRW